MRIIDPQLAKEMQRTHGFWTLACYTMLATIPVSIFVYYVEKACQDGDRREKMHLEACRQKKRNDALQRANMVKHETTTTIVHGDGSGAPTTVVNMYYMLDRDPDAHPDADAFDPSVDIELVPYRRCGWCGINGNCWWCKGK